MDKLDKIDIGWIFAFKNGEEVEYYKKHYYMGEKEDYTPSKALMGKIVFWVLDRAQGWNEAMSYLNLEKGIISLIAAERTHEDLYAIKEEFKFNEMFYWAFKYWAFNLTAEKLEEICPNYEQLLEELGEYNYAIER